MTQGRDPTPRGDGGLGMSEKVVRLHRVLQRHDIPHAFGGAIAVDYYRVPRATIDIDLNVFIPPADHARVVDALAEEFEIPDAQALSREVMERDQGKTHWGDTRIDLFFAASDFHEAMARRARTVEYEGTSIPILSAEDIVTIKVVFDRTQDWADIESVGKLIGPELDLDYVSGWLERLIGPDDPRLSRVTSLLDPADGGVGERREGA
jgi:hypothetical protein